MRILHVGDDFAALRPCGLTLYSDALMRAQAEAGHDVSYVFSGRVYPRLPRPRLKRWRHGRVRMFELIGSPNHSHPELGTRRPLRDLDEPAGERAFDVAVRETRPDLVHIHELARLPSSLIERARESGLPVVMTLHDYKPLCASVRLLDADGLRCTRLEVGEDCARNCAGAPDGPAHLMDWTVAYERSRLRRVVPFVDRIDLTPFVRSEAASEAPPTPPSDYQRRREVNVRRLELCDRLVAPSARVAEIYSELGVDRGRIVVQRLTLPHLEQLVPGRPAAVGKPLTFVTPGGCASPAKGSRAVLEAVRALGRTDYRLLVLGHVEPDVASELERFPTVDLHGPYVPADLGRLLDRADVGIVPSTWEEAHGFVGIELLAKGLPVIGSALGGIPEYVRDGETGWLNRSASGAELARLMAAALDDTAAVERLRESVRARRGELVRPMADHAAEVDALYGELTADQVAATSSPAARRAGS